MKKVFAVAAAMMLSVASFAQTEAGKFFIMPKVGVNMASVTETDDSKMRVGFAAGLGAGYQISDNTAITADFLYSQQGVKSDKADVTYKFDYINIPILCNYYVAPGLALKAGIQPAFLVSAKAKTPLGEGDWKDAMAKFDLSLPVGISYEFSNIVLDARYNVGLLNIFDSDKTNYDGKNMLIQVSLGYKLDI